jgi:DNA-binding MurR/RpiR family transcriptional regulator
LDVDILTRLQEEKSRLSQSELRIADILFNNFDFAVNASIIELAGRAEVSPPTVTRFCRRLGCLSFSDFKVQLAQTVFVGARYLNPETKSISPADVMENIITKAQSALITLHKTLDLEVIEKVTEKLAQAEMIYAFGSGGNSSMIAQEMQNRLFRLGRRVTASADHSMQLMMAAAARPTDVLIGSSISGRNHELVTAFRLARESGIPTIALTQSDSPVSRAVDLAVHIDLPEGVNIFRPSSTRLAYIAVVDIIANLVAYHVRDQATVSLRHIKQSLVQHRDTDDRQMLGD